MPRAPAPSWLPDADDVLHVKADQGDCHPAARPEGDGLCAAAHELDDVGVEADGAHGHDDQELREVLERRGHRGGQGKQRRRKAGQHEEAHKGGEGAAQAERAGRLGPGAALLAHLPEGQCECDGNDCQGPRQLDDGRRIERVGAGMHAVPGRGRGGDGGGVVDGGAGAARELRRLLEAKNERRKEKRIGKIEFLNSNPDPQEIELSKKLFELD